MSHRLIGVLSLAFILSVAALPAQAAPIAAGDFLTISDLPGQGITVGGAFLVKPALTSTFTPFVSFCLQLTESVIQNGATIFKVKSITTWAENETAATGGNNVTLQDPLSAQTAWIYDKYLQQDWVALGLGAFAGNTVAEGNVRGNAVQRAIWCLENEPDAYSCTYGPAVLVMNAAAAENPVGLGSVRSLNLLWAQNYGIHKIDEPAQDILHRNPIPEPASMLLFASGLSSLGFMVRRRRR